MELTPLYNKLEECLKSIGEEVYSSSKGFLWPAMTLSDCDAQGLELIHFSHRLAINQT